MLRIKEIINPNFGKAFGRISKALHKHTPDGVEWVKDNQDLTLLHVVGGEEYEMAQKLDLSKTILVNHCVFTTAMPIPMWEVLWKEAGLTISFHPIDTYTTEKINFFRTPWGADTSEFYSTNQSRTIKAFMTGHVAATECLDSVYEACKATDNFVFHTGENFKWDTRWYKYRSYMNDAEFLNTLNKAQYVTGLRKFEGFEMMCLEGAMTGAVPIVPDEPTYDFYKDFGIFVDMKSDIVSQLIDIFRAEYVPLDSEKVAYVREKFSWNTICAGIYDRVKQVI